ncbi:MAG: polyprenyl diphosphate synthase [Rickettsiales bacterium]
MSYKDLRDQDNIKIKLPNSLKHISIIMDGNARWAELNNKPSYYGHLVGSEVTKNIIEICSKINLQHLSLYLFSIENWNRPIQEINNIFKIYLNYLTSEDEITKLQKQNIKVLFLGSQVNLDSELIEKMANMQNLTKNNTGLNLHILFNYSGKKELVDATKKIAFYFANKAIEIFKQEKNIDLLKFENIIQTEINEKYLKDNLYSPNMPDVDLLIRTGNRNRVSNILPFHISYTEIAFLETLWPNFTTLDLKNCIENFYNEKTRTFGSRINAEKI